jgi:hypothetical protein
MATGFPGQPARLKFRVSAIVGFDDQILGDLTTGGASRESC